eukprot:8189497-Alexandrium_andersonii.AAC.1
MCIRDSSSLPSGVAWRPADWILHSPLNREEQGVQVRPPAQCCSQPIEHARGLVSSTRDSVDGALRGEDSS